MQVKLPDCTHSVSSQRAPGMALRYHERSVSHTTRAALQNTILTAHSNGKASAGQCVHPPVLQGKKRCLNEGWTPSASTAALGPAPNQLPAPGDAPFCSFLLLQAQYQKQAWPPIACIPKAFCGFIQYKHPTSFTFLPPPLTLQRTYTLRCSPIAHPWCVWICLSLKKK